MLRLVTIMVLPRLVTILVLLLFVSLAITFNLMRPFMGASRLLPNIPAAFAIVMLSFSEFNGEYFGECCSYCISCSSREESGRLRLW